MSITIAAIHTASPMIETTKALVKEYLPEDVRLINITDDSLIQEVIREGKVAAARSIIPIPIVKIDDAMTQQAIEKYSRIGVLATLASTLGPTINLLKQKAIQNEKNSGD